MSNSRQRRVGLALVVGAVLLLPGASAAQSTTATLSGVVKDEGGGVLPGVSVNLRNEETGWNRAVVTDDRGLYRIDGLPPGRYEVSAVLAGFKTEVLQGVSLAIGQQGVVNLTMSVGQLEERVVVTGEAALVQTTSAAVTSVVDPRQIRDLPLNARSFEQLATLQPGVVIIPNASDNSQTGRGRKISIAGARYNQVSYLLDGTDINNTFNNTPGSAAGNMLGVDTVREFEVLSSTYSAEYGRSAGGVVSVVTRSGTNELHGTAFEFHRNSAMDAKNFFDRASDPPPFTRNQFGGTVGGPVLRDRTFFFGGYEGLRQRLSLSSVATVPTVEARRGLLPGQAPIAVHPTVSQILDLFPLPNGADLGGGIARYLSSPKQPTDENYGMVKIDQRLTQNDTLTFRYTQDRATSITPDPIQVFDNQVRSRADYVLGEGSRVVSSSILNTARFAFNRNQNSEANTALRSDIPYFLPITARQGVVFGPLNVTGLTPLGTTGFNPSDFTQRLYEFSDTLTISRGAHGLKLGANLKLYQLDLLSDFTLGGSHRFNNLASFLRGQPQRLEIQLPGVDTQRRLRQGLYGFFVQDDFRVSSTLTLNAGLRYEFVTTPTEADGKVANFRDPEHDTQPTVGDPYFDNPSLRNFSPRVGFAWDPNGSGKTSVRGGFGVFHDQVLFYVFRVPMVRTPPFWGQGFLTNPSFPPNLNTIGSVTLADQRIDVFTASPEQPTRYQYSVTVQREILPNTMLHLGYLGARAINLVRVTAEVNTALPQTDADGRHFFLVNAQGAPLQPRRNASLGSVRTRETNGDSYYNSLQVQLQRRMTNGLQFQASYTFSKSMDTSASSLGSTDFATESTVQDQDCVRCDLGLSPFDVRHAFVASVTYDVPFAAGAGGWREAILGHWQVSGIYTAMTGNPFTPTIGFDRAGQRTRSGGDGQRPDLRPGASTNPTLGDPNQWYDISAFELASAGYFGDLGRNTLIGPGLATLDVSLVKNVTFGNERVVQFRLEAFNALNRVNFAIPRDNVVFTGVQVVNGQEVPLVNPNAGRIELTSTPSRQIQLGVKFMF